MRRADVATVARDVGGLLLMEGALMTVTVGVAVLAGELHAALGVALAAVVTAGAGGLARRRAAEAPEPVMKHGMVIAAAGWFATAAFGSLPFLFTAHLTPPAVAGAAVPAGADYGPSLYVFRDPLHALFESMSGWTGSGLTMAVHEPTLPRAIQWWRSLSQWVGGVGVIVLTVSILSRRGSGSYALYRGEAREEKIHPSVVSTVRTVWKIFLGYTLVAVVVLFAAIRASEYGAALPAGEAAWQALNHAMTALSTGGFSVTDDSIATYNSPLVEGVLLPVMTAGAVAFPVHYAVLRDRSPRELLADLQTRWLFVLLLAGSALLVVELLVGLPRTGAFGRTVPVPAGLAGVVAAGQLDAVRDGVFQFVSALTCTGFQSSPVGQWTDGSKLVTAGAMVVGGAAGSTVGGVKVIRAYTVAHGIRWQFRRVFLPSNAVVTTRMGDRVLGREQMEREFGEAAIVSILWLVLLATSALVLLTVLDSRFDLADALFEVASAQGNVGLSTGITGPDMPRVAEALFVLNMWVGRLEIIPVLVFARSLLFGFEP